MLTEHVLEIRFRPNARVLDHRGTWAEIVSAEIGLKQWAISENRVDFHLPDKSQRAFLSFRNFGATIIDQSTPNFFADKAKKLVHTLMGLSGFESPLPVERLGVRSKICQPYSGDFKDVADRVRDEFFKPDFLTKLGGPESVVDSGVLLYFKTGKGQINARIGATDSDEVKRLFTNHKDHPEASWYVDMDYFTKSPAVMSEKDIKAHITAFVTELAQRYSAIANLIKLA